MREFKKDNHFVPRSYLRRWSSDGSRVHMYRLLVSSERVPAWKHAHIRSIAYHAHLYTRVVGGERSDEFERWLDREFEEPAASSLDAAVAGLRLTKDDWWRLIRFLAAQDLRTPARLIEGMKRWHATVPAIIQQVTQEAIKKVELGVPLQPGSRASTLGYANYLPIRVTTEPVRDGDGGFVHVETDIGRGYWLFQMKHLLSKTAGVLHKHRWSLLEAPDGIEWVTSDDPVIRLNYNSDNEFDFGGGWGSSGSEILMPLSPKRLLYTRIGERHCLRSSRVTPQLAQAINRMIVCHAHRAIFSTQPVAEIETLRPRLVDHQLVEKERREWLAWADVDRSS